MLEGPLARGVALARPAVLLGLLAYRFEALVAWPSRTLQEALPVVTAVQVLYAVLSLPPAGSQLYRAAAKRGRPGEKKKMMMERAGPKPVTVRKKKPFPPPVARKRGRDGGRLTEASPGPGRRPFYRSSWLRR